MVKKLLLIFVILLGFHCNSLSQHFPMLSQYMFSGMVINPAYTGSRDVLSVTGSYRHQWVGFAGAPRTQSFFLHSPLKNASSNLGFSAIHDQLGVSEQTMIYAAYAYRIDFEEKGRLSFGLQAGFSLIRDRWSLIQTDESGDDVFINDSPVFVVPRFGTGIYYDHKKWNLGIGIPFLMDLKNGAYRVYSQNSLQYRPFMLSGGYLFKLNPDLYLRPTFLVKYLKESPVQVDLNLNLVIKENLWVGGSYRSGDALVGLLEYQLNPQLRMGYSYDYSISKLNGYNNGSHELMLRYEFGYKVKAIDPRYF